LIAMPRRRLRELPSIRALDTQRLAQSAPALGRAEPNPRIVGHPLLRLQRQLGNGQVQRVVALMRGAGNGNARTAVRRQQAPTPGCPTAVNFNFTDPVHVPNCGSGALRAMTNLAGVTWTLEPDTANVDPGSTISSNGAMTLAPTQAAGTIKARATASSGCFFERSLQMLSQPTGIASTTNVSGAGAGLYGGVFDHVFISADGNVASLTNVGVGERFTNVPSPAAASHAIVAPLFPFGGTFMLGTATLTPNATNNWFLTAAGGLGGTLDTVTIGQASINAGRFVQSASNPSPPLGLPAGFTLLQSLHWFCPQRSAANRWIPFVTVPHSRTLRNVGGVLEFVTTVNGVERVDAYAGPTAVFNLTATPASTPRSVAPPTAPGAPAATTRTVRIRTDTLPAALLAAQPLTWTIAGAAHGCSVAADPSDDHAAILTIGSGAGTVTVQVADNSGVNRARVPVVIT
jgi:hypothetical protein